MKYLEVRNNRKILRRASPKCSEIVFSIWKLGNNLRFHVKFPRVRTRAETLRQETIAESLMLTPRRDQ